MGSWIFYALVLTHYFTVLLLKLFFQLWALEPYLGGSCEPLTYPVCVCVCVCACVDVYACVDVCMYLT
jgi:hypothetical protein